MLQASRIKLRWITVIYWLLLIYIIAALVWWFISLEKQNAQMTDLRYKSLESQKLFVGEDEYAKLRTTIKEENARNTRKYIAEGVTFFILILVGAAFVYRSVRRQFRVQQQQQNFMMAVTHELKTPISVARLNLETLQKHNLDPDKQKKLIQMTLQETARLNSLTNNILIASQLEGGGYVFSKDELNLSDLVRDCVTDFKNRYPERNFISDINPEIETEGDALLLQILINNLLENAVKYSPKEKTIICRLVAKDNKIRVHIIDEGAGVPDAEKKRIFEKFYRVGNESTRKTQGTGLGLYLCSKIAADHNADISVTNNMPSGSNFTVTFHP